MIFPDFENVELIDCIRKDYDPLVDLVRPHITLVFPFEDNISNDELKSILEDRLKGVKPFDIELKGFSKSKDRYGNFLFMNVMSGMESIVRIHDVLYNNEFSKLIYDYHMRLI